MFPQVVTLRFSKEIARGPLYLSIVAVVVSLILSVIMNPKIPFTPYGAVILFPFAALVNFILYRSGAHSYATISPYEIKYRWTIFIGSHTALTATIPQNRIALHPGDSLIVTDDALLIWRTGHGYIRVGINAERVDSEDWQKLHAWASAFWPQPPLYRNHRAVVD